MKRPFNRKRIICIMVLVILCYPLLELFTPLNISGNPSGKIRHKQKVELNVDNWASGKFQGSVQKFLNDNIGLYTFLIRLHNQIEYSFFDNIHTGDVHKGKKNYLYELTYLYSYAGRDFIGIDSIQKQVNTLKALQDSLQSMGKPFLYCLSANKTLYYPEYIPMKIKRDTSNYRFTIPALDQAGVNYLDCNRWFSEMKDSLGHLLYPQYGIHWSHYSTVLVADSLSKIYSSLSGWNMPTVNINHVEIADTTRYYDNDIAKTMNLFSELQPDLKMAYPEFEWTTTQDSTKKLLVIGDSFFWDFFNNNRFVTDCFDSVTFFYYNMAAYRNPQPAKQAELQPLSRHFEIGKLIDSHDAVLILTNEPSIPEFGWGFPQDALAVFSDRSAKSTLRKNDELIQRCYSQPAWRRQLQMAAERRGISLDSMINIYVYDRTYDPYLMVEE